MNAAEVIAEIQKLPEAEQAVVVDFVKRELAPRFRKKSTFEEAANEVFTKHAELLRKLANS